MSDQWGVGNRKDDKPFDTTLVGAAQVGLIHGEHPHSRCDNNTFARFDDGCVVGFDGHRLLHEIEFRDYNYLKESDLSGSEIRRGGTCVIRINGLVCGEFFYRDVTEALLNARQHIQKIHDHPIQLWDPEEREKLIGRKVYYHGQPAKIDLLIDDQACVTLVPDDPDIACFKPMPYELEDASRGEGELDPYERQRVKEDIYSPHIWWWREK